MFYFEVVEDVLFLRGENFGCYFDGLRSNGGCCACGTQRSVRTSCLMSI